MYVLSLTRITRFTMALGAAGTLAAWLGWNYQTAAGFLAGSALSLVSIRSWMRFAEVVGSDQPKKGSTLGSMLFLTLRYVLVAGVVYATMKILGSTPVAILLGLLVSFAAVVLDLLFGTVLSK